MNAAVISAKLQLLAALNCGGPAPAPAPHPSPSLDDVQEEIRKVSECRRVEHELTMAREDGVVSIDEAHQR